MQSGSFKVPATSLLSLISGVLAKWLALHKVMVISFSHSQVYTSTQASDFVTIDETGCISASCVDHVHLVIGMPASMGKGKSLQCSSHCTMQQW